MKSIDILIKNATIYTVCKENPWAEAVAIKGNQIVFVGSNKDASFYEDSSIKVIDAHGKLILPGFYDNHCHPSCYTYRTQGIQVFNCRTVKDYQDSLRDYVKENPSLEIIKGAGWFFSDFNEGGPRKEFLDEIVDDRPIILYSGDFHNAWVNSKALEISGINKDTPDPFGGHIIRNDNGDPTGFLNEAPAVAYIESKLSGYTSEDFKNGILAFFKDANKVGITAVRESGVIHKKGYGGYRLLLQEDYTVFVNLDILIHPTDENNTLPHLEKAIALGKSLENDKVTTSSIKLFMDGVCEANTSMLEQPYLNELDNLGNSQWNLYAFQKICHEIDKKRMQIHVHAIGDRAVRYTLNALEYATIENGQRDSRHQIAHAQLINKFDIQRFSDLNVILAPTPLWYEKSNLYHQVELKNLGEARADNEYLFKTMLDNNIRIACGSDSPAATAPDVLPIPFSPFLAIQQGITRCNINWDARNLEGVLNPKERVTLEHMIRAHTIDSAYACFSDTVSGSIEVGKRGDIILLNQNLFAIDSSEIYKTEVLMTMVDGKIVYQKG